MTARSTSIVSGSTTAPGWAVRLLSISTLSAPLLQESSSSSASSESAAAVVGMQTTPCAREMGARSLIG
jgi:hypothetical protein